MKLSFLTLFALFLVCLFACQKTSNPPTPRPTNPGNPSNPGTTSGNIKVTGISPAHVYPGEEITITGSGFSADAAKDSVVLGYPGEPFGIVAISYGNHPTLIIKSASETKLVAALDSTITFYKNLGTPAVPMLAARINTGGHSLTTDTTLEGRFLPRGEFTATDRYFPNYNSSGCGFVNNYTFTNDSLLLGGKGFYKPMHMYIDGKEVDMTFDADNTTTARGYLPIDFFGYVDIAALNCTVADRLLTVKLVNGDGKIYEYKNAIWPAPNSRIESSTFDQTSYSKSSSNQALLKVKGYAIRSDIFLLFTTITNPKYTKEINLPAYHYPDETTVAIDLTNFPTPTPGGYDVVVQKKTGNNGQYFLSQQAFRITN